MKTVCNLNQCTSCTACVNICPRRCISIVNTPSFANAVIDEQACLNCKLCYNVCQQNDFREVNKNELSFWVGKGNDEKRIHNSSSGGIATLMSKAIIAQGGFVCGCIFKDGHFVHCLTNREEDLKNFQGSKYVKSDLNDSFQKIKTVINKSKVLFIGTPCQVYGLKRFLSFYKLLDNLFTIDLICHGTPQQMILSKYLNEEYGDKQIDTIRFRDGNCMSLIINEDISYKRICDPYMISFLNGLIYTENCYNCHFSNLNRVGDITLGDAWGYNTDGLSEGFSLIISSTAKGSFLLKSIEKEIDFKEADKDRLVSHNQQLSHPSSKPNKREQFFSEYDKKTIRKMVKRIYKKAYYKQFLKKLLVKMKII